MQEKARNQSKIHELARVLLGPFFHRYVEFRFRRSSKSVRNIDDAIVFDSSWNVMSRNMRALQIKSEIKQLLQILEQRKIKRMLEIGTYNGGTLFLFSRAIAADCKMYSIDLPRGNFGGGCPSWWVSVMQHIPHEQQGIHFIRDDSHSFKTKAAVETLLQGKLLDFLFIDGDHTYNGVKKDFDVYSPLVTSHGIIAFHDIVEHPLETGCEVNKFWNEIKLKFKHQEFVEDYSQKWGGIGVLYLS